MLLDAEKKSGASHKFEKKTINFHIVLVSHLNLTTVPIAKSVIAPSIQLCATGQNSERTRVCVFEPVKKCFG